MIGFIVGVYIFGMVCTGLFIKLNKELRFYAHFDLEYIDIESEGIPIILFWPLFMTIVLGLMLVSIPYNYLYKKIEAWQKNKENA